MRERERDEDSQIGQQMNSQRDRYTDRQTDTHGRTDTILSMEKSSA